MPQTEARPDGEEPGGTAEKEGAAELTETFERSVAEGEHRVSRTWPELLATGAVGGIDVGIGVVALLVIEHQTGSLLLGALGFTIGFLALALARSELFTENFLVPVAAVAAGRASLAAVARLWLGTLVTNLAGGFVLMAFLVKALPELAPTAVSSAGHYVDLGPVQAVAAGVLGGVVITLMTWMERGTEAVSGKLAAAVAAGFLLVAAQLNHAVVVSLLCFAALIAGAPFGYADWVRTLGLAAAGNMVGGLGLVTMLRLVQVGPGRMEHARRQA